MSTPATTAANILATLGAICWSIQLLPQIWQNYRRQHTHGLQPTMMLLWASAGIPLGIYNITRDFPIALWIQPQILTLLSLVTWAQTKYYPPGKAREGKGMIGGVAWCAIIGGVWCVIAGGIEVGIIYGVKVAVRGKTEAQIEYYWPVVLMGVLSAVLLCAGVGRHYVDIWKERTVRGISFMFVFIDALGDLTSLISVICWWRAGRRFDVLGCIVYASELVLWMGVMSCGLRYNFRPWMRRKIHVWRGPEISAEGTNVSDSGTNGNRQRQDVVTEDVVTETHDDLALGGSIPVTSGSRQASILSQSSRASYASGTVFQTASGRSITIGTETESGNRGDSAHDMLRLRSIVQV